MAKAESVNRLHFDIDDVSCNPVFLICQDLKIPYTSILGIMETKTRDGEGTRRLIVYTHIFRLYISGKADDVNKLSSSIESCLIDIMYHSQVKTLLEGIDSELERLGGGGFY